MRPRKPEKSATDDLFRSRLDQIIDIRHELVRLKARRTDPTSSAARSRSRPPIAVRRAASSWSTPRRSTATPEPVLGLDPKDGHSLGTVLRETEPLTAPKPFQVYRSGQKRGVHGVIKKELRRRSAVEAVIGHLKTDGHMDRNYLKGRDRDHANAVLTATGHNLRLVVKWLRTLLRRILAAIRTTS